MDNGTNRWGVGYGSIVFFEGVLRTHRNVEKFTRTHDILFTINRVKPQDCQRAVIVNIYTFGAADLYKSRDEFPQATCIVLAGEWNGYTPEAKELAGADGIGLLMPKEFIAALYQAEPQKYVARDKKGNPVYNFRAA